MKWLLVMVCCLASVACCAASDFAAAFRYHKPSQYFEFHYQRSSWDAASFARFADGFVDLVNRDFIKISFDYPIEVLVLEDRASFQEFLRTKLGESNPPNFGIYLDKYKLFATYEDSGLGTFAHEIMHPLVERSLKGRPSWAVEAIPSFFEKFFGYYDEKGLHAQWGYQNPWRLQALGPKLTTLDLKKLVTGVSSGRNYDTSELRMVSLFLWKQGKFQNLLKVISERDRHGFSSTFEAAMGMSLKEIMPLWQKYLQEISENRTELMRIPTSTVLENQAEFARFMRTNGLRVGDDSEDRRKH